MLTRNAYLALGYACNERCRCCPLVHKNDREQLIPLSRLLEEADRMAEYGVTDVTLSGGEPTLHPDLFSLVSHFHRNGIGVHILSNGERFADRTYADAFMALSGGGTLTVTTTFHSWDDAEHEYQNGTKGSFARSLKGLQYLDDRGLCISVKHCITANNYRQLPDYLQFVLDSFSDRAEIQLWGIDLYGLEPEQAHENFVDFQEIRPWIQRAIDLFEASGRDRGQRLTINNLPLCMCDAYYWSYFSAPEVDSYIDHRREGISLEANSGPVSVHCRRCSFRSDCMGAYFSDFEFLGDDIVSPPQPEHQADRYQRLYLCYQEQNVGQMVFSPYLYHTLGRDGYELVNYLTGARMMLRLRTEQILMLQKHLTDGIVADDLVSLLDGFGLNGDRLMEELMRKGIVE